MAIESREDEILYTSFTKDNGVRWSLDESAIRYLKENGYWRPPGAKGLRLSDEYTESSSSPESQTTPPATKFISSPESEITAPATPPPTTPSPTKYVSSDTTGSSRGSDTTGSSRASYTTGSSLESDTTPPSTKYTESGSSPESETTPPSALKARWSLRADIQYILNSSLDAALSRRVSCSISPCSQEDGDYICTSVFETWPELRKTGRFLGPTDAGLTVRRTVMVRDWNGMIERCVVFGPGFLMFKLSMKWIAKSIHKIVKDGMDICAPKLSVERAILYYFSGNIAENMHTGHLRSTVIGETLARILEYSRVEVIRKFPEEDVIEVHAVESEGDKAILSVDLEALWHALNVVKADWILHVTDVGQRDRFDRCISAAEDAGWIVNDRCPYPSSHVGFGPVQADDYGSLQSPTVVYLVNLLGEAKIRCKAFLLEQGKADEWTAKELEDTAEALGYDAVKYAVLKNNRLTKCTINFDEILSLKGNTVVYLHYTHAQVCSISTEYRRDIKKLKKLKGEKVKELILKNNEERELGLHLLRFTEVLREVCTLLVPHILCEYLYDLCKKFDSFMSQVVGFHGETSKLLLCEATSKVMRKCFHLLAFTPIHNKILKLLRPGSKLSKRLYCSDLTEQQLMELFCKGPCFRFDLCNVVLGHCIDGGVEIRTSYNKLIMFGVIQAETNISDPFHYGSFNILNRNFDNPLVITEPGSLSPHDICYCSLSVSTFVKITAKLYGTTYKGDRMENYIEYRDCYPPREFDDEYLDDDVLTSMLTRRTPTLRKKTEKVYLDDDAVDICDGNVLINFSKHFANKPNGGSGSSKLKGKDGYLDLYYVALKYAVEAALEVGFVATSKETKIFGTVIAYYGRNFSYDCCDSERYLYNAMLFEIKQPSHIEPEKVNLMRSALGVPAQYSLMIEAKLHELSSGDTILSGVCEFFVPVDGSSSVGSINGNDCSLKLKVDWKLPI